MNQELMILLISLDEASSNTRHILCRSNGIQRCRLIHCSNCLLQAFTGGYPVDLTNTARELAYEPRTNSNTQFPVQAR